MTVVAITLAIALAGALALIAWLVHDDVNEAHKQGDTRVAQVETEKLLELEQYEHKVTQKALEATRRRAAALEEALAHALSQPHPDADLPAADFRERSLRLAEQWREADRSRDSVPAELDGAVPDDASAEASHDDAVLPGALDAGAVHE